MATSFRVSRRRAGHARLRLPGNPDILFDRASPPAYPACLRSITSRCIMPCARRQPDEAAVEAEEEPSLPRQAVCGVRRRRRGEVHAFVKSSRPERLRYVPAKSKTGRTPSRRCAHTTARLPARRSVWRRPRPQTTWVAWSARVPATVQSTNFMISRQTPRWPAMLATRRILAPALPPRRRCARSLLGPLAEGNVLRWWESARFRGDETPGHTPGGIYRGEGTAGWDCLWGDATFSRVMVALTCRWRLIAARCLLTVAGRERSRHRRCFRARSC